MDTEPKDRSVGWKPWGANTDRWWDGIQWTETYREIETKEN